MLIEFKNLNTFYFNLQLSKNFPLHVAFRFLAKSKKGILISSSQRTSSVLNNLNNKIIIQINFTKSLADMDRSFSLNIVVICVIQLP